MRRLIGGTPTTELTLASKQFKRSLDLRTIGGDEAGRGSLVGNVVAAAVSLPSDFHISGLTDSKKLSEKKRDALYRQITQQCEWSVSEASSIEIDQLNVLQATILAMKRAIIDLQEKYARKKRQTIFNVMVEGFCVPQLWVKIFIKRKLEPISFLRRLIGETLTTELTLASKQFKDSLDLRAIGVDEAG